MMKSLLVMFPPIPADTARAALSLYGKGHIYIRVGEHLDELFLGLEPLEMEIFRKKAAPASAIYALMSAIQLAEKLTNGQIVEAVHNRIDLKYALHLPMNYPRFDPLALCEFRKRLAADPVSQQAFFLLLEHLAEFGLLNSDEDQPLDLALILKKLCMGSRLEIMMEAMYEALEVLTVANYEWLRQETLPHWYARYSRQAHMPFWPFSEEKWKASALEIAADIQYLLGEIDRSQQPDLVSLPEIQRLGQKWADQFEVCVDEGSHPSKLQIRSVCTF